MVTGSACVCGAVARGRSLRVGLCRVGVPAVGVVVGLAVVLPAAASGSWSGSPRVDLAAFPAPAFASAATSPSEKKITATLIYDSGKTADGGCYGVAVLQFPDVRDAVSYRIGYFDSGKRNDAVAPPFYSQFGVTPGGTHRIGLSGGTSSNPGDCADGSGYFRRFKAGPSVAIVGERTCDDKPVPKGRLLVEGTVRYAPTFRSEPGGIRRGTVLPELGVRVKVSGPTDARPVTDEDGYYCATVAKGRYVLTPEKGRTRYLPPRLAVSVTANRSGLDFRHEAYSISGKLTRTDCFSTPGTCLVEPLEASVQITSQPGGEFLVSARAGSDGKYTVPVDAGPVTVTPGGDGAVPGDVFTPPFTRLTLTRNTTGVNFNICAYPRNNAADPVARVRNIEGRGGAYVQRDGIGPLQRLGLGDTIGPRDRVSTDNGTSMAFEFACGGRIGVNPGAKVIVFGERRVVRGQPQIVPAFSGPWEKAQRLQQPLELQTKGGVMGIKG